jgi:anti-sigma factor RsiW
VRGEYAVESTCNCQCDADPDSRRSEMNNEHDPYESTSWRRAALAFVVILGALVAMTVLALALGLKPKF